MAKGGEYDVGTVVACGGGLELIGLSCDIGRAPGIRTSAPPDGRRVRCSSSSANSLISTVRFSTTTYSRPTESLAPSVLSSLPVIVIGGMAASGEPPITGRVTIGPDGGVMTDGSSALELPATLVPDTNRLCWIAGLLIARGVVRVVAPMDTGLTGEGGSASPAGSAGSLPT